LHPAAGQGFVAFRKHRSRSRLAQPKLDRHGGGPPSPFPATQGSHPSKSVLVDSRNRVTAVRCLLVVTGAVPPRPQPKPRHARWVLANQEPRGHRRPEPGRPAGTGHRLDTVKLRSAANGGPPRHRVVQASANRCAARADRPADSAEAPKNERSSPGRSGMPARRIRRWATREHPRVPRAPSDGRDRQTTALHARHAEASRADSSRRRERPTSGPCSVDESVVLRRRCRRTNTRSFHGLCSPPRSTRAPLHARSMPGPGRHRGPKPGRPRCGPGVEAGAAPLGSLWRLPLASPAEARRARRARGPKPTTIDAPFQRAVRGPGRSPHPRSGRSRPGEAGRCRRSLSGGEVVSRGPRCGHRAGVHPKMGPGCDGAPRASSPTFMRFFDVKERSAERLLGFKFKCGRSRYSRRLPIFALVIKNIILNN
jgi:hypothetical protein